MTTTHFEPSNAVIAAFGSKGKSLLSDARIFEQTFGNIVNLMREGKQIPEHGTVELWRAYHLVATHYKVHDVEAGKRLAAEMKRWLSAKVKLPYYEELQDFLKRTPPVEAKFEAVHSFFE